MEAAQRLLGYRHAAVIVVQLNETVTGPLITSVNYLCCRRWAQAQGADFELQASTSALGGLGLFARQELQQGQLCLTVPESLIISPQSISRTGLVGPLAFSAPNAQLCKPPSARSCALTP